MREYTIIRRPREFDWAKVPALQMDQYFNTDPTIPITAQAQLCYDDEALYIRLRCTEQEIRAEYTGLLDEISEDSCLEFFFSPIPGDLRYFNLECNLNGAMYFGFGSSINDLVRLVQEDSAIAPRGVRTEDGWEISYEIPHSFVRRFFPEYAPASGKAIRANCYKCGDKTSQRHYLTWNPVVKLPRASFHNPSLFGIMYFE